MSLSLPEPIRSTDKIDLKLPDESGRKVWRLKGLVRNLDKDIIHVNLARQAPLPAGAVARRDTVVTAVVFKDKTAYVFSTTILRRIGGKQPGFHLARPHAKDIRVLPRRDFFRLVTQLPVKIHCSDEENGTQRVEGSIVNLSAGGCRIELPVRLPFESGVTLDFELALGADGYGHDMARPMLLHGLVRDSAETDKAAFVLGVEFMHVAHFEQRALTDYMHLLQRRQIKTSKDGGKSVPHQARPAFRLPRSAGAKPSAVPLPDGGAPAPQASEPAPLPEPVPAGLDSGGQRVMPPLSGKDRGKTLLVAEDEEGIRDILCEALRLKGYSLLAAGDGEEALRIASHVKVDLLLTDLMMPRMNGWRLVKSLRQAGVRVPVIAVTGYVHAEGEAMLASNEIAAFLVKPVDLRELTRKVDAVLASHAAPRTGRVLVIENEDETRRVLVDGIEAFGSVAEIANSPAEGAAKTLEACYDLAMLDLFACGTAGSDFCRQVRSHPATVDLPILALAANASQEHVRRAVDAKVNGFLLKPLVRERLRRCLARYCRGEGYEAERGE